MLIGIRLSVVMLSVVRQSVVMLIVVRLSVVRLIVVAPLHDLCFRKVLSLFNCNHFCRIEMTAYFALLQSLKTTAIGTCKSQLLGKTIFIFFVNQSLSVSFV
jgi:hypothetical protein